MAVAIGATATDFLKMGNCEPAYWVFEKFEPLLFEIFVVVREMSSQMAPASGHNMMSSAASERMVYHSMLSK
ncbi:hypothetical protein [Rhizobium beringeri]|uniref:hypothetical protein n=1 Tax=Rhizobium beringeri TaxID=3019934 RepID=UPI003B595E1C